MSCSRCTDPDEYDMRHNKHNPKNTPEYGDWLYEQRKDKELEKRIEKEVGNAYIAVCLGD